MSAYSEKFKDPRWQKKRLEILERDEWRCQVCFDDKSTLHVHHKYYLNKKDPWDYQNDALLTLCESCHEIETNEMASSLQDLCTHVRQAGFLSNDVMELCTAFCCIKSSYPNDVTATIIKHALTNKDVMDKISDIYFDSIKPSDAKVTPK